MTKLKNKLNLMTTSDGFLAKVFEAVKQRAMFKTDICDHLEPLFLDCLGLKSHVIVELGSGDGESTFVLERVAKMWKATLVSVDIEDRREVGSYRRRFFVRMDDIRFAGEFSSWCDQKSIKPQIDILFIDTSHLYDHTVQEIKAWFPFLSPRAKVIFHDTNLKEVFKRRDGSSGSGWNNDRGVIRAIEEYLGESFNENENFIAVKNGWMIRHYTYCNGLMILDRYEL